MLFYVEIAGSRESDELAEWYKRLEVLLKEVPGGIAVKEQQGITVGPNGRYAGIEDFLAILRDKIPSDRPKRVARGVMYWLIKELHHALDVRCTQCEASYRACLCDRPGKLLDPEKNTSERYWVVSWQSMQELPLWTPPRNSWSNQRLAADFLKCIQRKGH